MVRKSRDQKLYDRLRPGMVLYIHHWSERVRQHVVLEKSRHPFMSYRYAGGWSCVDARTVFTNRKDAVRSVLRVRRAEVRDYRKKIKEQRAGLVNLENELAKQRCAVKRLEAALKG